MQGISKGLAGKEGRKKMADKIAAAEVFDVAADWVLDKDKVKEIPGDKLLNCRTLGILQIARDEGILGVIPKDYFSRLFPMDFDKGGEVKAYRKPVGCPLIGPKNRSIYVGRRNKVILPLKEPLHQLPFEPKYFDWRTTLFAGNYRFRRVKVTPPHDVAKCTNLSQALREGASSETGTLQDAQSEPPAQNADTPAQQSSPGSADNPEVKREEIAEDQELNDSDDDWEELWMTTKIDKGKTPVSFPPAATPRPFLRSPSSSSRESSSDSDKIPLMTTRKEIKSNPSSFVTSRGHRVLEPMTPSTASPIPTSLPSVSKDEFGSATGPCVPQRTPFTKGPGIGYQTAQDLLAKSSQPYSHSPYSRSGLFVPLEDKVTSEPLVSPPTSVTFRKDAIYATLAKTDAQRGSPVRNPRQTSAHSIRVLTRSPTFLEKRVTPAAMGSPVVIRGRIQTSEARGTPAAMGKQEISRPRVETTESLAEDGRARCEAGGHDMTFSSLQQQVEQLKQENKSLQTELSGMKTSLADERQRRNQASSFITRLSDRIIDTVASTASDVAIELEAGSCGLGVEHLIHLQQSFADHADEMANEAREIGHASGGLAAVDQRLRDGAWIPRSQPMVAADIPPYSIIAPAADGERRSLKRMRNKEGSPVERIKRIRATQSRGE
ncbi:MAG: hypothetical protein M1818_000589 [Claussenomyces sp. TS43310]|nr:MAG: hypothetical protein M1818_000589 [Claussenomyces sp. TS43310]